MPREERGRYKKLDEEKKREAWSNQGEKTKGLQTEKRLTGGTGFFIASTYAGTREKSGAEKLQQYAPAQIRKNGKKY